MSTIRAVRDTFRALIEEITLARGGVAEKMTQATRVSRHGNEEAEKILMAVVQANPDPAQWPASALKIKVQDSLEKVVEKEDHLKIELVKVTPKDVFADRRALARLKSEEDLASDSLNMLQKNLLQSLGAIPLALRLRWGEKLPTGEHAELFALMTPPPSRFNVVAQLRASEDQRAMWSILRADEARNGAGNLAAKMVRLGELQVEIAQAETRAQAMAPERLRLQSTLSAYDDLKDRVDRRPDLAVLKKNAVMDELRDENPAPLLEWLTTLAPDQVKPYRFARAKEEAPHRIIKALSAQKEALEGIEKKLKAPMSKLDKGVRQAPSKHIAVDDVKIAHDVRQAIEKMKPLGASATSAIEALNQLHVEPQSVSQARFYQKAQATPTTESNNWLLMWLLLDGQFNSASALWATDNPALALGMAAVLPAWSQDSWDSVNALPDLAVPADSSSVAPPADWSVPAANTWDNPADGLSIPQGDFAQPSLSGSDWAMPGIDLPSMPADLGLPAMDFSMPAMDFSMPSVDFSMPSVDFSMPSVDFSMPSVDFGTSSFDSSSSFGGSDSF
jgi:hypothetical protein